MAVKEQDRQLFQPAAMTGNHPDKWEGKHWHLSVYTLTVYVAWLITFTFSILTAADEWRSKYTTDKVKC